MAGLELYGLVNNARLRSHRAQSRTSADDEASCLVRDDGARADAPGPPALPSMRECSGAGRIVNISSIAGLRRHAVRRAPHWREARTGGAADARCDAEVAGDAHPQVGCVEPGGFKTGIWEELERDVVAREAEWHSPRLCVPPLLAGAAAYGADHGAPEACVSCHRDGAHCPRTAEPLPGRTRRAGDPFSSSGSRPHS